MQFKQSVRLAVYLGGFMVGYIWRHHRLEPYFTAAKAVTDAQEERLAKASRAPEYARRVIDVVRTVYGNRW